MTSEQKVQWSLVDDRTWQAVERAIWPNGPAAGTGSGAYAALKGRVIEALVDAGRAAKGRTNDHAPDPVPARPRTVAGRALMSGIVFDGGTLFGSTEAEFAAAIAAIEAEAVAAYQRLTATPAAEAGSETGLDVALATIEAMSGDAADLHDLIHEAAAMRTVLGHLLGNDRGRIHDSGCGTCDAGRALLTADHELPSYSREPRS